LATYTRIEKTFEPAAVAATLEPRALFELALLKCLLTEIPEGVEYDSLSLSISSGRLKIVCSADKVSGAEAARQKILEASARCSLLNLVSLDKLVLIRRSP
jgi:hypothetical protein